MKTFVLSNLATNSVHETTFEDVLKLNPELPNFEDKDALKKWRDDANTDYVFYSLYEGEQGSIRISEKANPALYCHGIVADYDMKDMDDETLDKLLKSNVVSSFAPTYAISTYSGGVHLVFLFETPVHFLNPKLHQAFVELFFVKSKAAKILPFFDKASYKPHMYYTYYGHNVKKLNEPIKEAFVNQILFEVGANAKVFEKHGGAVPLPMKVIKKELEKRFPNKWKADVKPGARGLAFWDPAAKDPTEATLHKEGMYRFTDGQYFVPWGDTRLFGPDFVAKYEADRISTAVSKFYYDESKHFWRRDDDVGWFQEQRSDVILMLKSAGIAPTIKKGEFVSEVDTAVEHIVKDKRVFGAAPFIYNPEPIVKYNGKTYLNNATVKMVPMVDRKVEWNDSCLEYTRMILDSWWEPESDPWWFLKGWMHWDLVNCYRGKPQGGHALFLAGPASVGKTLFSTNYGHIKGGSEDVGKIMMGQENFNEHMFHVGLVTIDDDRASSSHAEMRAFESRVKQFIANPYLECRQMYHAPMKLAYNGRIWITLNLDADSMRMLPSLNQSNRDKTIMLKIPEDAKVDFPIDPKTKRGIIMELLAKERPFFARYLHDLELPDRFLGDPRFGIKEYVDPELEIESTNQSLEHGLQEIMEEFAVDYYNDKNSDPGKPYWGTSTQLLQELSELYSEAPKVMEGLNHITLPKRITTLIERGCDWLEVEYRKSRRGFIVRKPTHLEDERSNVA